MNGSGIYQILNVINGHRYVGSAVNLRKRWGEHRSGLKRGKHHSAYLQAAWNLYGGEAFAFSVLEHVPNREQLTDREDYWFGVLKPEYNIAQTAGSSLGCVHSAEAKARMSEAHTGKALGPQSEEHKRKLSEANRGYKHTDEARWKISAARMGGMLGPPSDETKRKISLAKTGKALGPQSEEHKRKRREARLSSAKLTERGVREIRLLLQEGVLLQREIAAMYGVSRGTISDIKHGRTWAHLRAAD